MATEKPQPLWKKERKRFLTFDIDPTLEMRQTFLLLRLLSEKFEATDYGKYDDDESSTSEKLLWALAVKFRALVYAKLHPEKSAEMTKIVGLIDEVYMLTETNLALAGLQRKSRVDGEEVEEPVVPLEVEVANAVTTLCEADPQICFEIGLPVPKTDKHTPPAGHEWNDYFMEWTVNNFGLWFYDREWALRYAEDEYDDRKFHWNAETRTISVTHDKEHTDYQDVVKRKRGETVDADPSPKRDMPREQPEVKDMNPPFRDAEPSERARHLANIYLQHIEHFGIKWRRAAEDEKFAYNGVLDKDKVGTLMFALGGGFSEMDVIQAKKPISLIFEDCPNVGASVYYNELDEDGNIIDAGDVAGAVVVGC